MLPAEVEHLLGFGDAADGRTGEAAAAHDQAERGNGERLLRGADERDVAIAPQQIEVSVHVVAGGDSVENEVEAAGVFLHLVGVPRNDHLVRSEPDCVFLLVRRSREDDNVGAERMCKLHAHVAESSETGHANFLALGNAPVAHRGISCNSGAKQRGGPGVVEVRRNPQDKSLVNDNVVGVAAVRDASQMLVGKVVGKDRILAELLETRLAFRAGAVRVHQAADCGEVARLELGDCGADLGDAADDFVAGHAGVDRGQETAPLIADLVEIGMADAAEQNLYLYVVFGWVAPRDRSEGQRRSRTSSGVGFCVGHVLNLDARRTLRYAKYAIVHAKYANLRSLGLPRPFPAAKRRKNAAHGVSRGWHLGIEQAPKGRKRNYEQPAGGAPLSAAVADFSVTVSSNEAQHIPI